MDIQVISLHLTCVIGLQDSVTGSFKTEVFDYDTHSATKDWKTYYCM